MTSASSIASEKNEVRRHLFYETSHSPALAELVGYEKANDIIDFCFIANPYYPTESMMQNLQENLPNLIKSYPPSNPRASQADPGDRSARKARKLDHRQWGYRINRAHQYSSDRPHRHPHPDVRRVHRETAGPARR